jgi:hypothetical protein
MDWVVPLDDLFAELQEMVEKLAALRLRIGRGKDQRVSHLQA